MTVTASKPRPQAPFASSADCQAASVVVLGAGGNIGSHLAPLLARSPQVGHLTLVDRDVYEEKNLAGQAILPRDVGRPKALVQKRRCDQLRPGRPFTSAVAMPVEQVPLGWLSAAVLVSCLDSRVSRQFVNEAAWRLGVPWVDAAVDPAGLLCRVNVYRPGDQAPCIECSWTEKDYEALEVAAPCLGGTAAPATNGFASLGAVAAGLAAIETEKILAGDWEHAACSRQVMLDLRHHRQFVSRLARQPTCRFDHQSWDVQPLELSLTTTTVGQLLGLLAARAGGTAEPGIAVAGQMFATTLVCTRCADRQVRRLALAGRNMRRLRCSACCEPLVPHGFSMQRWLQTAELSALDRRRSLHSVGLWSGDVVSVAGEQQRHFLLLDPQHPEPRAVVGWQGQGSDSDGA